MLRRVPPLPFAPTGSGGQPLHPLLWGSEREKAGGLLWSERAALHARLMPAQETFGYWLESGRDPWPAPQGVGKIPGSGHLGTTFSRDPFHFTEGFAKGTE